MMGLKSTCGAWVSFSTLSSAVPSHLMAPTSRYYCSYDPLFSFSGGLDSFLTYISSPILTRLTFLFYLFFFSKLRSSFSVCMRLLALHWPGASRTCHAGKISHSFLHVHRYEPRIPFRACVFSSMLQNVSSS